MVADFLSKLRLGAEIGVSYFRQPPLQVSNVLDDLCEPEILRGSFDYLSVYFVFLYVFHPSNKMTFTS